MVETDVDIYSFNSNERNQSLRISLINNQQISLILINKDTQQRYRALVTLAQLEKLSNAFISIYSIKDALTVIKNAMQSGRIILTEDPINNTIEMKFNISLNSINYPPFDINLMLDPNSSQGNISNSAENAEKTTYANPIFQQDPNRPPMELEIIEPILQVHYPDGTTESTPLQPRIQGEGIQNISNEQLKMIKEQMNRDNLLNNSFHNRSNSVARGNLNNYSTQTNPLLANNNLMQINQLNNIPRTTVNNQNINQINMMNQLGRGNPLLIQNLNLGQTPTPTLLNNNLVNQNNINERIPRMYNSNTNQIGTINRSLSLPANQNLNQLSQNQNIYQQNYQNQIRQTPTYTNQTLDKNNYKQISKQQIALAQMASKQNQQNPNFNNLQTITLNQNDLQSERSNAKENVSQEQDEESMNIEALYMTDDGKIIFRNGLLRGIIHKYSEIDDVVSRIQDILLKGAKFYLVYKAFDLDDTAQTFHQKCDNLAMSLVLVETQKGARFGGFTTKSWRGKCLKKKDNYAFVFNLENRNIYDIIPNQPAIGCFPKFGPVFFGCQIRIYDNFFTKGGTTCHKGLNYRTNKDFELNNGEQTFLVKDIEVYRIDTIDVD